LGVYGVEPIFCPENINWIEIYDTSQPTHNFITRFNADSDYSFLRSLGLDGKNHWNGKISLVSDKAKGFLTEAYAFLWSGSYYFRCRFLEDQLDLTRVMNSFWQTKEIKFLDSTSEKIK